MKNIQNKNFIVRFVLTLGIAFILTPFAIAHAGQGFSIETMNPSFIDETRVIFQAYFSSGDIKQLELGNETPTIVFQYGETSSVKESTPAYQVYYVGSRTVSYALSGLEEGEDYYVRAVLYTQDGTYYGDRIKFSMPEAVDNREDRDVIDSGKIIDNTTSSSGTNTTTAVNTPSSTVSSVRPSTSTSSSTSSTSSSSGSVTSSRLSSGNSAGITLGETKNFRLSITNNQDEISRDEFVTYDITAENKSRVSLENVRLAVALPSSMDVVSVSGANWNSNTSEDILRIGDLRVGETESIKITARLRGRVTSSEVIARVDAVYGVGNVENTEQVTAFDIDEYRGLVVSNVSLGAAAFQSGFFPTSIFGWILIILIVGVMVYVVRRYFLIPNDPILRRPSRV